MDKTATLSSMQQAAQLCYSLFRDGPYSGDVPVEGLQAIQSVVGSPISAAELLQISQKLRQNDAFSADHTGLMLAWQKRLEGAKPLSEHDALTFIQQLFGSLDHAAIYDHGIIASVTQLEKGMISGVEMHYPGNMPCWTLHLTTQGQGLLINEQMEAQVGRGDMMLFHPESRYHCDLHPAADQWEHLWALFQPRSHWSEWLKWETLDEGILRLHLPEEPVIASITSLFRQLVALKDDPLAYQSDLQYNRLEEILIRANACGRASPPETPDQRIQCACDYMQEHLAERFSIEGVATVCNLSTSRLAHLFKEQMGLPLALT